MTWHEFHFSHCNFHLFYGDKYLFETILKVKRLNLKDDLIGQRLLKTKQATLQKRKKKVVKILKSFRKNLCLALIFPASLMAATIFTWSAICSGDPSAQITTSTCLIAFTKLSWWYMSPCETITWLSRSIY